VHLKVLLRDFVCDVDSALGSKPHDFQHMPGDAQFDPISPFVGEITSGGAE